MEHIRQARLEDAVRLAEIEVFNYRLNFYPVFRNDVFYFSELNVADAAQRYRDCEAMLGETFVYDDGVVKGFVRVSCREVVKLFVEPVLQGRSIGAALLAFAAEEKQARFLWALEKNVRAISFYERHGFCLTDEKKLEEDTEEYLVCLRRGE